MYAELGAAGKDGAAWELSPLLPEVAACNGRGGILHLASTIWESTISLKWICISSVEITTADRW